MVLLTRTILQQTLALTRQTDFPKVVTGENRTILDTDQNGNNRNFDGKTIDLDADVFGKSESRKYKHELITTERTTTGYEIQETEADLPQQLNAGGSLQYAEDVKEPSSFKAGKWQYYSCLLSLL